jgi:spermidine synthase
LERESPVLRLYVPTAGFICGLGIVTFALAWSNALPAVNENPVLVRVWALASLLLAASAGALYFAGRIPRITNSLRMLSILQIAIALCAVLARQVLPVSGGLVEALSRAGLSPAGALAVIGSVASLAILGIPCFLLGGILTLGTWLLPTNPNIHRASSTAFHSVFFLGGACGIGVFGLGAVPWLGSKASLLIAAGAVGAVGAVGLLVSVRLEDRSAEGEPLGGLSEEPGCRPLHWILHFVYVFVAVVSIVVWMRVLSRLTGHTDYARSSMLMLLLLGIAAGLAVGGRTGSRRRISPILLAATVGVSGILWAIMHHMTGDFASAFLEAYSRPGGGWTGMMMGYVWTSTLTLLLPGVLLGAELALFSGLISARATASPSLTGGVFAATGTAAFGALIATCYLPAGSVSLGSMLVAVPVVLVVCTWGLLVILPGRWQHRLATGVCVTLCILILGFSAPRWDSLLMTAGVFTEPERFRRGIRLEDMLASSEVVFYEDRADHSVALLRTPSGLVLKTDGAAEASTGEDTVNQILAAHIPLLLHSEPRNVLLIGLSTGLTLRSLACHGVSRIYCVESSKAGLNSANVLNRYIGGALGDDRVKITVAAPEFYLLTDTRRYDVVLLEPPSHPYTLRDQSLSADFIGSLRPRLSSGGIIALPLGLRNLSRDSLKSILRAFVYYYPFVSIWWTGGDGLLCVAGLDPITVAPEDLDHRIDEPSVRNDLATIKIVDHAGILSLHLMGRDDLIRFAGDAPLIRDDSNSLLYDLPKQIPDSDWAEILAEMTSRRGNPVLSILEMDEESPEFIIARDRFDRCVGAHMQYVQSVIAARAGQLREAATYFENAHGSCPENQIYPVLLSDFYTFVSRNLAADGRIEDAINVARRAVEFNSDNHRAFYNLASIELTRDARTAVALLARAIDLYPYYVPAYLLMAEAELKLGEVDSAAETLGEVLSIEPLNPTAHRLRALSFIAREMLDDAQSELRMVLDATPEDTEALAALAYTWLLKGELGLAQKVYEQVLEREPNHLAALNNYATILAERGEFRRAVGVWTRALELDPGNRGIIDNIQEARQKIRR